MNPRIRLAGLAVLCAALAVVVWQWRLANAPLDKAGSARLSAPLAVSAAPIWVAQDKGYFARAGVESSVANCSAGKDCVESMLRGDADFSSATEFVPARFSFTYKDLRILGTTAFSHDIRLLADKSKGIDSLASLKGKKLGVRLGSNGEYFLSRLLTLNGMGRDAITWVDLKPQDMAASVGAGETDAVLIWSPFSNQAKAALGDRLVEFDGQAGEDYYFLLMARQEWLSAQPKVAQRVMLALIWATEWMSEHPAEARVYLADKFGVSVAEIGLLMENIRFSIALPQALLSALEAESRWLESQGAKGTPVANSLDLIAAGPLQAAAPEAVTMIRGGSGKR